jgi:hypothetical protein
MRRSRERDLIGCLVLLWGRFEIFVKLVVGSLFEGCGLLFHVWLELRSLFRRCPPTQFPGAHGGTRETRQPVALQATAAFLSTRADGRKRERAGIDMVLPTTSRRGPTATMNPRNRRSQTAWSVSESFPDSQIPRLPVQVPPRGTCSDAVDSGGQAGGAGSARQFGTRETCGRLGQSHGGCNVDLDPPGP